jgi:hypothetical protein
VKKKIKNIISVILTSLLITLGIGTAIFVKNFPTTYEQFESEAGWVNYTSTEGGFSVYFPSDPQFEVKKLEFPGQKKPVNYNQFKACQDNDICYSVSYLNFPGKWKLVGSKKILNKALDIIVASEPGAKLTSRQLIDHKGYSAIQYQFQQDDQEVTGRLIIVGTTLFQVTVVSPTTVAGEFQPQNFLNSFDLKS